MPLFKSKNITKPLWGGPYRSSKWWRDIERLFKKDTGGTIDRNDPEYTEQKIYMHWIKCYL